MRRIIESNRSSVSAARPRSAAGAHLRPWVPFFACAFGFKVLELLAILKIIGHFRAKSGVVDGDSYSPLACATHAISYILIQIVTFFHIWFMRPVAGFFSRSTHQKNRTFPDKFGHHSDPSQNFFHCKTVHSLHRPHPFPRTIASMRKRARRSRYFAKAQFAFMCRTLCKQNIPNARLSFHFSSRRFLMCREQSLPGSGSHKFLDAFSAGVGDVHGAIRADGDVVAGLKLADLFAV